MKFSPTLIYSSTCSYKFHKLFFINQTPDIVLFNNADGNYEASFKPNVVIYADADDNSPNINWIPPAIYKSSCTIDVKYFPFDEQVCEMRFGSWTFDAQQVRLKRDKPMVNLEDYLPSGTWDVISAPGVETYSKETNRMELVYHFRIRRKTLFYTVNLIIPTVLISFLSIFVFYLPTDEGEKMTLCISILLALVVFLLLVSKILPPTSMVIPLISKYLIFTLMMNIVTILNTVIIINWNYRTPRTHNMPKSVRFIFIEFLPKILFMKRPEEDKDKTRDTDAERDGLINNNSDQYDSTSKLPSNRKLLLSKNLSLELNETEPLTFTNLGLINNTNNKNNKTYSSNANINKLETNGDYIGANLNRSSNLKLNRSQNFLDKNKDTLCSNNSELVNLKLANSNHSIPSNASLAVRPKQQQHKNLDKLFISSKNNKTQNQGQLNNTLIQQQQHKNEVLNRNRFNLNTKSSNGNRNEIEAPNKRVHTQTKLASNDNSNSQRGTKSRRHQQYAQSQSYSLEYDTYTTTSDDDRPCDFSPEILEAADKITYITNHIRSENDYEEVIFNLKVKI